MQARFWSALGQRTRILLTSLKRVNVDAYLWAVL